jgi:GDP-4-dehydro-6-deoxy-D-mannose reductase
MGRRLFDGSRLFSDSRDRRRRLCWSPPRRWLSKRFPEARLVGTHYKDSKPSPGTIKLDIRDAQAIDRAIGEFAPDGVAHLAAISQAQEAQQAVRATFDVNLGGTMNIAEAMRLQVPQARLLFVSTAEVYGDSFLTARDAVDERAAIDP